MGQRRVRWSVVSLVIVVLSAAVHPGAASANFANSLSGNCSYHQARECYADSSTHNFYGGDLGPRMGWQVLDTLYGSYDTTFLTITDVSSHTTSVDVYYHYGVIPDEPGGLTVGRASCQGPNNSHYCDHWHVIFDGDQIANWSDEMLKWLACHETGHTVGLAHPWDDDDGLGAASAVFACMRYDPYFTSLGGHNHGHIDWFY